MAFNRPNINYRSSEWGSLKVWLKEELESVYKRLANPTCTDVDTQQLRGRASLISQMLDFEHIPSVPDRG